MEKRKDYQYFRKDYKSMFEMKFYFRRLRISFKCYILDAWQVNGNNN